jgi:GTPase Era involved in 16S rRNA processing
METMHVLSYQAPSIDTGQRRNSNFLFEPKDAMTSASRNDLPLDLIREGMMARLKQEVKKQ